LIEGEELRQDEREYLADYIMGNIKKPKHRPKDELTEEKKVAIGLYVHVLETLKNRPWPRDAAVKEAEKEYEVSKSSVYDAIKYFKQRKPPEDRDPAEARYKSVLTGGPGIVPGK
jgi:hypothetical protein